MLSDVTRPTFAPYAVADKCFSSAEFTSRELRLVLLAAGQETPQKHVRLGHTRADFSQASRLNASITPPRN
jgi:hypothetical protein